MGAEPRKRPQGPWTREEIAREERARLARERRDREQTPAARLEETLRLSRFLSELGEGERGGVRAG